MDWFLFWAVFCAMLPLDFRVVWTVFLSQLVCSVNCCCPPFSEFSYCDPHVQPNATAHCDLSAAAASCTCTNSRRPMFRLPATHPCSTRPLQPSSGPPLSTVPPGLRGTGVGPVAAPPEDLPPHLSGTAVLPPPAVLPHPVAVRTPLQSPSLCVVNPT